MPAGERKPRSRKLTDFMVPRDKDRASGETSGSIDTVKSAEGHAIPQNNMSSLDEIKEIILRKAKSSRMSEKKPETQEPSLNNNGKLMEIIKIISSSKLVRTIECNQQGICNDGRRIGEIFTDEYGIKRQRGFINTTRLPIFLDLIVEEAEAMPALRDKAYIVKTKRGSLALVPDDFICELNSRYGIIIPAIEKCVNYKSGPWIDRGRGTRRKNV
ncbi:hypothetical protein [Desulfurococcus amylolyticus]|uniref:hypothetical protein n=1 Tax=Desulfurococcus amylolyticus TaxID=94694 RepID=UPI0005B213B1|nr:hypothetical protein [Desulfurococcus amylolyticus]